MSPKLLPDVAIYDVSRNGLFKFVVVTRNEDELKKAMAENPACEGAALVEYLRATLPHNIRSISVFKDGGLDVGPNGEASIRYFDDEGKLTIQDFYKEGVLQDGPKGEPAVQLHDPKAGMVVAMSYERGTRTKEWTPAEIASYQNKPVAKEFGTKQAYRPGRHPACKF